MSRELINRSFSYNHENLFQSHCSHIGSQSQRGGAGGSEGRSRVSIKTFQFPFSRCFLFQAFLFSLNRNPTTDKILKVPFRPFCRRILMTATIRSHRSRELARRRQTCPCSQCHRHRRTTRSPTRHRIWIKEEREHTHQVNDTKEFD